MKKDKNSRTTSQGLLAQNDERAVSDTNTCKKYKATLFWTQHNQATVIIEANSLAEAREKADEIDSDEIDDWNPCDGDLYVDSVEPVKGGKAHE